MQPKQPSAQQGRAGFHAALAPSDPDKSHREPTTLGAIGHALAADSGPPTSYRLTRRLLSSPTLQQFAARGFFVGGQEGVKVHLHDLGQLVEFGVGGKDGAHLHRDVATIQGESAGDGG